MIEKIYCKSAIEFINILRPSNNRWGPKYRSWIFRGQCNSSWNLTPSIFRQNTIKWTESNDLIKLNHQDLVDRELKLIRRFVKCSDDIGLKIPGDSCNFRLTPKYRFYSTWPEHHHLEILAIAQHHGIPTRLLDFTHDGLIAAHFALSSAFESDDNNIKYLAVWAFSMGDYWEVVNKLERRIQVVSVPTSDNMYLFKQKGIFIFDAHLSHYWDAEPSLKSETVKLEKIIQKEYSSHEFKDIQTLLVKIMLPKNEFKNALAILYKEGLTHSSMMPNYDNVVKTMQYEDKLNLYRL